MQENFWFSLDFPPFFSIFHYLCKVCEKNSRILVKKLNEPVVGRYTSLPKKWSIKKPDIAMQILYPGFLESSMMSAYIDITTQKSKVDPKTPKLFTFCSS